VFWNKARAAAPIAPPLVDETLEWADSLDARALRRMAVVTLPLLQQPERWIHRRVEKICFKDCETARHQVSVDFTLPPNLWPVSVFEGQDVYIAPLFLLLKSPRQPTREGRRPRKRYLVFGERRSDPSRPMIPTASITNLDLVDQEGRSQALLTRTQSRLLANVVLIEAAQRIMRTPLDATLRRCIKAIANRPHDDAQAELSYLFRACSWRRSDPRRRLRRDPDFVELAYSLASHSPIACLFTGKPPRRAILKLSYDEPVNELADRGNFRPLRSLGWRSERFSVLLNEIGAGSSYHVEIEVPAELSVNAIGLVGARYRHFGRDLNELPDSAKDYFIQQIDSGANSGSIYVPEPLPGRRYGQAWIKLRARRPGFPFSCLVASCITTAVLFLAALAAPEIVSDRKSEAAVVALLLVPTVLAAYVARPDEHAITTKMLRVARMVLIGEAALTFLAVCFLLMAKDGTQATDALTLHIGSLRLTLMKRGADVGAWLQLWWYRLAAVSVVGVVLFTISNILPFPYGKNVYKPLPRESEAAEDPDPLTDGAGPQVREP